MATTLVATDGGILAFSAPFFGSAGSLCLDSPIAGTTVSAAWGYWMTIELGTVYVFGASGGPVQPHDLGGSLATGVVSTATGLGYRLVDLGGFVHRSGDATTYPLNP